MTWAVFVWYFKIHLLMKFRGMENMKMLKHLVIYITYSFTNFFLSSFWKHNFIVVAQLLIHVWLICYPMDHSSPGSSVYGVSQARILGWVAIFFSRVSSWPRDQTLCLLHWQVDSLLLSHQGSPYSFIVLAELGKYNLCYLFFLLILI